MRQPKMNLDVIESYLSHLANGLFDQPEINNQRGQRHFCFAVFFDRNSFTSSCMPELGA